MPSQGGGGGAALPGLDELQKDPVAALSKGFGWFTSTVTKTAKTVNNDFIQPTAKQDPSAARPSRATPPRYHYFAAWAYFQSRRTFLPD